MARASSSLRTGWRPGTLARACSLSQTASSRTAPCAVRSRRSARSRCSSARCRCSTASPSSRRPSALACWRAAAVSFASAALRRAAAACRSARHHWAPSRAPEGADRAGQDRLAVEEPPQLVGEHLGRGVPFRRVLLQAPQADRLQVAGAVGRQPARRGRWVVGHLPQRVQLRHAAERGPAGEQLVEDRAERVHVGRRPDLGHPAAGLLGGHVRRRPEDRPGLGERLGRVVEHLGQPEVGDLGSDE